MKVQELMESSIKWIKAYDSKTPVEMIDPKLLKTNPNEPWGKKYESGEGGQIVKRMAERMKRGGSWECLEVLPNNTVIDGQHRLKAALLANLGEVGIQRTKTAK